MKILHIIAFVLATLFVLLAALNLVGIFFSIFSFGFGGGGGPIAYLSGLFSWLFLVGPIAVVYLIVTSRSKKNK